MPTEARYDRVLKIIEGRANRIKGMMDKEFKGKQPFDTKKMPDAEIIAKYLSIPEEAKQRLRAEVPQFNDTERGIFKKMEGMKK